MTVRATEATVPHPTHADGNTYVTLAYLLVDPHLPLKVFESLAYPQPPTLPEAGTGRTETPQAAPALAVPVALEPMPPAAPPSQQEAAPAPQPQEGAAEGQGMAEAGVQRQPLPRGEAERRALAFLDEHPDEEFTPGQIAKAIDARGCRDLMLRLWGRGEVRRTCEKPLKYQRAR